MSQAVGEVVASPLVRRGPDGRPVALARVPVGNGSLVMDADGLGELIDRVRNALEAAALEARALTRDGAARLKPWPPEVAS